MIDFKEIEDRLVKEIFDNLLYKQITSATDNDLNEDILEVIHRIASEHNKAIVETTEKYDDEEYIDAVIWEAGVELDNKFVTELMEHATVVNDYNLKDVEEDVTPTWVGDKLKGVIDELEEMISTYEEGYTFVLISPLMASVIQSVGKSTFISDQTTWKGKSITSLMGKIESRKAKADVYCYLYDSSAYSMDADGVVIGNFNKDTGAFLSAKLIVTNLSFA